MAKAGFWSDPNTEPKRAYRWIMLIGGIHQWIIKKTVKPSFEVSETEHKYINHTFYYPGRVTWQPITVTLVDPVTPDASKTMEGIIRAAGYNFPKDPNDVTTISKAKAVSSLGRVEIQQFGPEGDEPIEKWVLKNAWVKNVKFGQLDYDADDMVEIELEIRFDFAEMALPGEDSAIAPGDA